MCKIMIMPGIPKKNVDKAWKWAKAAAPHLTEEDPHGFGYAAYSPESNAIFGEKWLDVNDAFKSSRITKIEKEMRMYTGTDLTPNNYDSFGEKNKNVSSLILHSRFATCGPGIKNTHPFINKEQDVALIHNGVIYNAPSLVNITSTCDSETILNEYTRQSIGMIPFNIQRVVDALEGWYAVALINNQTRIPFVDIFKEDQSDLFVAWVKELEMPVYCTSLDILQNVADELGFTLKGVREVPEGKFIRLHAITRERLELILFSLPLKNEKYKYTQNDNELFDDDFSEEDLKEINNRWK